jgi:PilZ domain
MTTSNDRRQHPRFTVDPMYSALTVRPIAGRRAKAAEPVEGHVYEVSLGGMRFELDEPLPLGARIEVDLVLPGIDKPIHANARVARVFDAVDDPGPRRMVAEFETFAAGARAAFERFLGQKWLRPAPVQAHDEEAEATCEVMIETSAPGSKGSRKRKSASAA